MLYLIFNLCFTLTGPFDEDKRPLIFFFLLISHLQTHIGVAKFRIVPFLKLSLPFCFFVLFKLVHVAQQRKCPGGRHKGSLDQIV